MNNQSLEIKNLSVRYPSQHENAIEDIEFSVPKGSITMLIGPNGSGKTTIMRAILNLVSYEGEILVLGKPLAEVYGKVGYVPQRFTFDETFPMTVEEFISLSLTTYYQSKHERLMHMHNSLELVGAHEFHSQLLSDLSGGQLQRVLLARALSHQPQLLLLDEPESGVDVAGEQTFYDVVQHLVNEQGISAIVSSHELDIVYAYATQVICVNKRMFCRGIPQKVLNHEMFVDLYGRDLKFYGHQH